MTQDADDTEPTPGPWMVEAGGDGDFIVTAAYDEAELAAGHFDLIVAHVPRHADAMFMVQARGPEL